MPNKQAAIKALRQTKVRTERNRNLKRTISNLLKETVAAIEAKDKTKALELSKKFQQLVDKAVKTRVFAKNAGNRKKSKVMMRASQL